MPCWQAHLTHCHETDIAYVVREVSQFMTKPRQCHLNVAMKILEYIKRSPGKGFLFKKNDHKEHILMLALLTIEVTKNLQRAFIASSVEI